MNQRLLEAAARTICTCTPPLRATRLGMMLLLSLLTAVAALAQEPEPPSTIEIRRGDEVIYSNAEPDEGAVRVLFVGNSLTYFNEMPWLFEVVSESVEGAPPVTARFAGRSGISLERQWEREETRRLLRTEEWDFVVLQEKSFNILGKPGKHSQWLGRFVDEVRGCGATPVVYATWPKYREQEKHGPLAVAFARRARELNVPLAAGHRRGHRAVPGLPSRRHPWRLSHRLRLRRRSARRRPPRRHPHVPH